jgi:DNA topoisomerase III
VKNYEFDFRFAQWGNCSVTMTSVSGHLTSLDFADRYRKWETTPPGQLFEAETIVKIDPVSLRETAISSKFEADEHRNGNQ